MTDLATPTPTADEMRALSGGGRAVIDVDVYSDEEATSYLSERLTGTGAGHLLDTTAARLAATLGYLPLALSYAVAYLINEDVRCDEYLDLYLDGAPCGVPLLSRACDQAFWLPRRPIDVIDLNMFRGGQSKP